MPVILRLEGLNAKAGTQDIRTFFESLHIPDGGVYIVGGRLGEAFIAFSRERDAQLAIRRSGHFLKGSVVTLHISSMDELEHRLQSLLKRKTSALTVGKPLSHSAARHSTNAGSQDDNTATLSSSAAWPDDPDPANLPPSNAKHTSPKSENEHSTSPQPLDSSTAFILGVCTVLQGLKSGHTAVPIVEISEPDSSALFSEEGRSPKQSLKSNPGYVGLLGLPASTTKKDICQFFEGLSVQEAIINVKLGLKYGCLVKFANCQDVVKALCFNQQSFGSFCVEVQEADEKMWNTALKECKKAVERENGQRSFKQSATVRKKSASSLHLKRPSEYSLQLKPSKNPKGDIVQNNSLFEFVEYVVMVNNLPKSITKTEIKELFCCPNISHKNVLHLLDSEGNTTDTSFLIFNNTEDFDYAMNLSGCHLGTGAIKVSLITKAEMREMMAKTRSRNQRLYLTDPRIESQKKQSWKLPEALKERPNATWKRAAKTCLFVRNLPASVRISQIKDLFYSYRLKKEDIFLLHDGEGSGIGQAVIKFETEKLAAQAQMIHGRDFLGTKVLITRIDLNQMEDIMASV
ncbi:RNA binding motif protein 12Ba isoform 1-T2 [Menidia menidia]